MLRPRSALPALLGLTLAAPLLAADAPAPSASHTLARGTFRLQVDLSAVLEAPQTWPIQIDLLAWQPSSLRVVEAAPQGASVKAGDPLIKFETRHLETAIRDAELALAAARTRVDQTRQDLRSARNAAELDLAAAQRARDRADADLQRFLNTELPLERQRWDAARKDAQFAVDYAREQLRQLQKMYQADDLTEATEEIVLRRQRRAVEQAELAQKISDNDMQRSLKVALPRRQQDLETALKSATLALESQQAAGPLKVQAAQQAAAKADAELTDAQRRLDDLRHDLAALSVTSPGDGIVYYGRCERGKWSDASAVAEAVRAHGSLQPRTTILTVVAPRPLVLHATVAESALENLAPGLAGLATPLASPLSPLPVAVRSIAPLPIGGTRDVLLEIRQPLGAAADLRPGMSCDVKLTYEKPGVVLLPRSAVQIDPAGKPFVNLRDAAGRIVPRPVRLGRRNATDFEVLSGVSDGDILAPAAGPAHAAPQAASAASADPTKG